MNEPGEIGHHLSDTRSSAEQRESAEVLTERLGNLSESLLRVNGTTMAGPEEPGFSGDAASLFVLAEMPAADGQSVPTLIKAGWGEFSHNTFTTGVTGHGTKSIGGKDMEKRYEVLRSLPFDVYCVGRHESYLPGSKIAEQMQSNPVEYLQNHAKFVAREGKVIPSKRLETGKRGNQTSLDYDIKAEPAEELIRQMRNSMIANFSQPEKFAAYLHSLTDDPKVLGQLIQRQERLFFNQNRTPSEQAELDGNRDLGLLTRMGLTVDESVGQGVGDPKAMQHLIDLKQKFNFEKNEFSNQIST